LWGADFLAFALSSVFCQQEPVDKTR